MTSCKKSHKNRNKATPKINEDWHKKPKILKAPQPQLGMNATTSISGLRTLQAQKQLLLERTPESLRGNPYEMCQLRADTEREPQNALKDDKFPLASPEVACPLDTCQWALNGSNMLAHYLANHSHLLMPLHEITDLAKPLKVVVPLARVESDRNRLISAIVFKRAGSIPYNGLRNANLPEEYRKYATHTFVMFFACRTHHWFFSETPEGYCKVLKELLVIWATTPTPQVPLRLKAVITDPMSKRCITKVLKIRNFHDDQTVKKFIESDSNCMISTMEELKKVNGENRLVVDLSVLITDEQRINS